MSVNIRRAAPKDAEAVERLASEFAEYLRSLGDVVDFQLDAKTYIRDGFGANPAFSGLVAEHQGEVIGYLLYYPGYEVDSGIRILHIADLFVQENHRRQGVGRRLMESAVEICRNLGGKQLFWSVYVHNKAAVEIYKRLGARPTRDLAFMRLDIHDERSS